jgi:hypothetical protein
MPWSGFEHSSRGEARASSRHFEACCAFVFQIFLPLTT